MANSYSTPKERIRRTGVAAALAVTALLASGCSGLVDSALENVVEEGLEAAIESESDGEDFELDLDFEGGSIAFQAGDAGGAFGADLSRPGWLDDSYALPEGLIIVQQFDDAEGSPHLVGILEGSTVDEVVAQQRSTLERAGYSVAAPSGELTADPSGLFGATLVVATHPDGAAIELFAIGQQDHVQYTAIFHEAGSTGATTTIANANRTP